MTTIGYSQGENHTIRNTVIVASVGAGICAGGNAISQKYFLRNSDTADRFVKSIESNRAKIAEQGKTPASFWAKHEDGLLSVIKNKKFNFDCVKTAGLHGAAILGGIYMAYKGLSSLFRKD